MSNNKKITELTQVASTDKTDLLYVVQSTTNDRKATIADYSATTAETKAGTVDNVWITPSTLPDYFEQTVPLTSDSQFRFASETVDIDFNMSVQETDFSGIKDPVMYWGWNIAKGARIDGTTGAIWQQFEYDYWTGSQHVMEWNFNIIDDSDNSERFLAFALDKEDHDEAYWWFWIGNHANSFFMVTEAGTSNHLLEIYSKDDTPMFKVGGSINAPGGVTGGVDIRPTIVSTAHPDLYGTLFNASITDGDGSDVSVLATMVIQPPSMTLTGGSAVLYPATLLVNGPPASGTYPWAFWVNSGNSLFTANAAFGAGATDTPADPVDIVTGTLRQRASKTPSNAGDTGRTGQICWDASYIYVCVNTNTWKRAGIATW